MASASRRYSISATDIEPKARHTILFVDAYDSFTNNIIDLLESNLRNVKVHKVTIDDHGLFGQPQFLSSFDAVVIGPGPGNPQNPGDVGLIPRIWSLSDNELLPVLGICLGFQSLAYAYGAHIRQLRQPQHGIVLKQLKHNGQSIFEGIESVSVTKYHSLAVIGPHGSLDRPCLPSQLQLLAWEESDTNGVVPMAVKHSSKPFFGLQYHPESVCSNTEATKIIANWWKECRLWNLEHRSNWACQGNEEPGLIEKPLPIAKPRDPTDSINSVAYQRISLAVPTSAADICEYMHLNPNELLLLESANTQTTTVTPNVHQKGSCTPDDKSRYSIIGFLIPLRTLIFKYDIGKSHLDIVRFQAEEKRPHSRIELPETGPGARNDHQDKARLCRGVWDYISSFMSSRVTNDGDPYSPFWGGLMGYTSYEFGVSGLGVETKSSDVPDLCFAFVERSVVIDHHDRCIWVQSVLQDDPWICETSSALQTLHQKRARRASETQKANSASGSRHQPSINTKSTGRQLVNGNVLQGMRRQQRQKYVQKVLSCQSLIAKGESYELCLTNQAYFRTPQRAQDPILADWLLYRQVCRKNPAPFAAFFALDPVTIVSSSPERFLSWNRAGKCDMRPIKGTLSKQKAKNIDEASDMLASEKERAENLMIVDLIRHDLHGVCGTGRVRVKKLMNVEEYATVYQLVTTIEGWLPSYGPIVTPVSDSNRTNGIPEKSQFSSDDTPIQSKTGIDVLAACLPPGSMTGAPKKRSCQILEKIENEPRGVYSGVIGYMCLGGAGDFSVVIRTAVRLHGNKSQDANQDADGSIWRIGAGGAITTLSDPAAEYEEMQTKLDAIMRGLE